jgi:hypothetical protein
MTQDLRIWKNVQRGQAFDIEVDGMLARPGMRLETQKGLQGWKVVE